ncbi:P44/Msp2 family outer membrane protein [Anaplasma marginale]|uniref:OMP11 n=2 Tax=Anaplasma marginale TaxID=770 RepID=Q2V9J7_ANAMF|nr:P44/Msp2 family outer membrane protein [Anaplasma marginale]ABB86389.1 OMP11 [Anaplasma marginale str. Florida]ACM49769.1 Outer membrane protein 11 [Anaplasma marginale str. Florida]AXW84434.1 P44/Msp2 family outer membrane protein [Anaplasma marginale]AXW85368.1 P44/Msp2 family outer membrane protein [Anaplasma marginale]
MSFVRFLAVSLGCVFLAYSSSAVSFSLDGIARGVGGLYIGGMYKPASPIFGDLAFKGSFDTSFRTAPLNALPMLWFAGQDQDVRHVRLNGVTIAANSFDPWPVLARGSDYHSSAHGVAVVLGYPVGQVRAELELAKQSFDVGRGGGPASGHDEGVVGDLYASEGYRYSAVHMKLSSGKGAPATPPATTDGGDANAMVIVKNEGVQLSSVLASLCRDFSISLNENILPYVCAGFGLEKVSMFDSDAKRVSYQAKIGASYKFGNNVHGFASLYYRALAGNGEVILTQSGYEVVRTDCSRHTGSKTHAKLLPVNLPIGMDIAYFGLEAGLRLSL